MRKPIKKRKRPTRHINTGKETAGERAARTAVQYIMGNPHYNMILKAIRAGTPNSKIAEFCISRGVFDVNQKTAVGYLQYFRKMQPGLCRPQAPSDDEAMTAGYDHLFDGNTLILDEETEILKMIALQKARLGIAFKNEREIGVLMQSHRKEFEELRELILALAKLRGKLGNSLDVNLHGYSDTVKDDLKGIQQDEGQRNTIAALVADLAQQNA